MNFIIYTVIILVILYFLLKWWSNVSPKKMSKSVRIITILLLAVLAVLFAVGGKFLLTLPLTLASLALVKLKGLVSNSIGFSLSTYSNFKKRR